MALIRRLNSDWCAATTFWLLSKLRWVIIDFFKNGSKAFCFHSKFVFIWVLWEILVCGADAWGISQMEKMQNIIFDFGIGAHTTIGLLCYTVKWNWKLHDVGTPMCNIYLPLLKLLRLCFISEYSWSEQRRSESGWFSALARCELRDKIYSN